MKINLMNDSATKFAFLTAIGAEHSKVEKIVDVQKNSERYNDVMNDDYEVVFTVNGVELDFKNVVTKMFEVYEERIKIAASDMIFEAFQETYDKLENIASKVKTHLEWVERDIKKMFGVVNYNYDD